MNHPSSEIGISTWSYHRLLFGSTDEAPFGLSDAFAAIRALGVRTVELNSHFFLSTGAAQLRTLRAQAERLGLRFENLAVDDDGDLSSGDESRRRDSVRRTVEWLDIAVALGCPTVRQNSGGDSAEACLRSFRELAAEASLRGRRIAVEAHGGFSSDAAAILPIATAVRAEYPDAFVLIPDFGNVIETPERDRYAQIADLAPFAGLVHPKMHTFDESGEQTEWDTRRLVALVRATGFAGPWIIEYEGDDDELDGVRQSVSYLDGILREVPMTRV